MIEHIVVEFGTEQDRVELEKYEKKCRVDECLPVYESVSKDNHSDLVVKVDSVHEEFTVKELRRFNADLEYFVFHHKVFYTSVKWKRGVCSSFSMYLHLWSRRYRSQVSKRGPW